MRREAVIRLVMRFRGVTLAATDELDDFVAIAGSDQRLRPLRARKNFEIAFDGDAATIETEFAQQIGNARAGLRAAIFAVDRNCDCRLQKLSSRGNFWLGAQLKVQTRLRLAVRGLNDQCAIPAAEPRHIKRDLRFSVQSSRRRILRRLGRAVDACRYARAGNDRAVRLLEDQHLQRRSLSRQPIFGVQQPEHERIWRTYKRKRLRRSGRRRLGGNGRRNRLRQLQSAATQFVQDRLMLRANPQLQRFLARRVQGQ